MRLPFDALRLAPTGDAAAAIVRGVRRTFAALGQASLTELTLANGRRADVCALAPDGTLTIVEVKSGVPDFAADKKWPDYAPYCDLFYFAVAPGFPLALIPEPVGLIVADAYGAEMLRAAVPTPLSAARRKAMLLRFGLVAATRLHRIEDPIV